MRTSRQRLLINQTNGVHVSGLESDGGSIWSRRFRYFQIHCVLQSILIFLVASHDGLFDSSWDAGRHGVRQFSANAPRPVADLFDRESKAPVLFRCLNEFIGSLWLR